MNQIISCSWCKKRFSEVVLIYSEGEIFKLCSECYAEYQKKIFSLEGHLCKAIIGGRRLTVFKCRECGFIKEVTEGNGYSTCLPCAAAVEERVAALWKDPKFIKKMREAAIVFNNKLEEEKEKIRARGKAMLDV